MSADCDEIELIESSVIATFSMVDREEDVARKMLDEHDPKISRRLKRLVNYQNSRM
jgi:hypothetical protein